MVQLGVTMSDTAIDTISAAQGLLAQQDSSATSDSCTTTTSSRKRKITQVLDLLDAAKFNPPAPVVHGTYAPWDRTALLVRLASFRAFPIHARSSPLCALTLARHGWTSTSGASPISSTSSNGNGTSSTALVCLHCHARVVLSLASRVPGSRLALERKFAATLSTAHGRTCFWGTRPGSGETLLRIDLADKHRSMAHFGERCRTFEAWREDEDGRGMPFTVRLSVDTSVLSENMSAVEKMALFGWSLAVQGGSGGGGAGVKLLVCNDCQRRVLLARDREFCADLEHYDYCPWIWHETQGPAPAWILMAKHYDISLNGTEMVQSNLDGTMVDQSPRDRVKYIRRKLGFS